jgi:AraC-like DNA-binding protein
VRTEQSDSSTCQPIAYGLDGSGAVAAGSSDELARATFEVKRSGVRESGGTALRLGASMGHLLASAHEDLASVREILRSLRCSARLLGSDGSLIPRASELRTPIYDSEGRHFASLQVIQGELDHSGSPQRFLRALIECTARSITERLFRLAHRREWVVAAMRRDSSGSYMLLAVDQDQGLLGADRKARQWLDATTGIRFDRSLALSTLFRAGVCNLPARCCGDAAVTLVTQSGEGWIGLVTPPDTGADVSVLDQRTVLHARPRLNSLLCPRPRSDGCQQPDLARDTFGRVREYVDAHLGSSLEVHALALTAGLSDSHFSRSFHKAVGMSPHRYIVQCRVIRAQELLATTRLSLTEIALTSGFADHSHFSRRFHELTGVPPREFRRLARGTPR